jgi:ATP-binding cassette subfamily F protein 3
MITLTDVTLQRGPQRLLDNINLVIYPGHHVGLVGQNGCGKSSLFQLLLRELHVDGGTLSIPGSWRVAHMAQEVSASDRPAVEYVLDGDTKLREIQAVITAAEISGDNDALAHGYADLDTIDGFNAHYRAEQLLHGLGFTQDQVGDSVNSFSGGWRIRLNLAQALMSPSDLLLLDEPTNHLDMDAMLWLEQWLKAYKGTLVLISHDRDFLDNIVDDIIHIEHQKANSYRGNYSAFELQRAARLAEQQSMYEKQQRRVGEIEEFVRRFKAKASKAKQAQSRVKELERMEKIAPAHVDSPFRFSFREADKTSTPLINLSHANLGYGETEILHDVGISLPPGARIGLLGPNGAGKSTLVKSLVGDISILKGERVAGEHLRIGYFAQHQLEALDLNASAMLHLQRISPRATEQQIRTFLGGFNFHGDKALDIIAPFSGGEKARLALALVAWEKPNLLLLDEPTNHLDLEMRHALCEALQEYSGALVVISHDRHLLRNTVDEYWRVYGGEVVPFDGTLEDYYDWLKKELQRAAKEDAKPAAASLNKVDKKTQRQESAQRRQQLSDTKNKLRKVETELSKAQQKLAAVETQLADESLYEAENKAKLQTLLQEQVDCKKQVSTVESVWLELNETLESLDQED